MLNTGTINIGLPLSPDDVKSSELVRTAFGIYGRFPVFNFGADEKPGTNKESYHLSVLNTKVWDRVILRNHFKGDPISPGGNIDGSNLNYTSQAGENVVMPAYEFPDAVLIEVSRKKDMIETKIAGADGTVKEEISLSDWDIMIRGFIINYDNEDYPKAAVKRLLGVFVRPLECGIDSKYFTEVLKIYNVVFGEVKLKEMEGYPNVQAFEIPAKSDNPIEFQLIKK